jgi:phosphonate transport system substrate-binding protein
MQTRGFIQSLSLSLWLMLASFTQAYARQNTLSIGLDQFMPAEKFAPVADYLSVQLGVPVTYENFGSLTNLSAKYDLLYINAFGYAYAKVAGFPFESFVARADASGTLLSYKSCLIAHAKSGIKTPDQIIAQSKSINLSFTYASSTSGHIVPRIYLTQLLGQSLEEAFKQVEFGSEHVDVINKVKSGTVDLGGCSCLWVSDEMSKQPNLKNEIHVVWESEPIPHAVWAINTTSNQKLFSNLPAILNAMLKDKEIWKIMVIPDLNQYSRTDEKAFDFFINQLRTDGELEFYLYYYESVSK